jgi:hypothetical protein
MFAALAVMVVFVNTWGAMFPTIAEDVLHRGAGGLGGLTLAVGIGAIAGAVVALVLEGKANDARLQFVAAFLFAGLVIGVALSSSYSTTLFLTVAASTAGAPFFINNMAASQAATPRELKAKVVSVRYIVLATQPLGMMLLGAAAEAFGPQTAMAGSAVIGIALLAAGALSRPASLPRVRLLRRRARKAAPVISDATRAA